MNKLVGAFGHISVQMHQQQHNVIVILALNVEGKRILLAIQNIPQRFLQQDA